MFFDWFSLVYVLLLLLAVFVGIKKGFLKSIGGFGFFIISMILAIYLSGPLGRAIFSSSWGNTIQTSFRDFVINKVPEASTALTNEMMQGALPTLYEKLGLPSFLYDSFANLVISFLPTDGSLVEAALPLAEAAASLSCTVIAFAIIFVGAEIIFGILLLVVSIARKGGKKPSGGSRCLGAIIQVVETAMFIYVISFVLVLCSSMQNDFGAWIVTYFRLNDAGAWSFSKWLIQQNWMYSWLLSYLHF